MVKYVILYIYLILNQLLKKFVNPNVFFVLKVLTQEALANLLSPNITIEGFDYPILHFVPKSIKRSLKTLFTKEPHLIICKIK